LHADRRPRLGKAELFAAAREATELRHTYEDTQSFQIHGDQDCFDFRNSLSNRQAFSAAVRSLDWSGLEHSSERKSFPMTQAKSPIALITGGSRGLGKSMALHLAAHGVDSIITYRSAKPEAEEVIAAIRAKGQRAVALALDVSDSSTFAPFAETVRVELEKTWARTDFDFLVNNAGTGAHVAFLDTSEEKFDEMMKVHLKAPFFLSQKLVPLLADGGRIVNISSGLARFTFPGSAVYAVMKGGVEVLTRYLAKELGSRKIAVNTLAPGAIATDFNGGTVRDNPEVNKAVAGQTALGRVGLADDIGGAIAMLLSPENHWITGQRIEASGGMML
jgi:NAD(P)-dependent dehydrogenase (short-subunit alcohol dehydrogenase family)